MGGKSKPKPQVTQSQPQYTPEQLEVFAREKQMLTEHILPIERNRILGLGNLIQGDTQGATSILSPAFAAARQGQARLGAATRELPTWVSAPIQESAAWAQKGIPRQLRAQAPDELSKMTQQLMSPQFGAMLQPGQTSKTTGGGPSSLETGLAIAGTVATVAAIGVAI